jgi:branched-chain amino acid transport system substrate-binding protein
MLTTATSDPDSEQYQQYQAVMQTFAGEDAVLGGTAPQSYQVVLAFARAMEGVTGEVTPEVVREALTAMPLTELPLGDGIMFQCNGQQVAITPNICSKDVLQTTLNADGEPGEFTLLEGGDLLDLGG